MAEAIESANLSHNEIIKAACPTLAGNIAATLADPAADRLSEDDQQFLKFHGAYQQDDRDKRKTGKEYMFMVRGRLPGGIVSAAQYLAFDRLSSQYANDTLRITSRQGFQFHGVVKSNLAKLIRGLHESLCTTLAACGDVNRNVMAPPTPSTSPLNDRLLEDARRLSQALLPVTPAYHEIWMDGVQLNLSDPKNKDFSDPLYGKTYLPRKFKIAFAIPPLNDTDIFSNCMGLIGIGDGPKLLGYNLTAGGGLAMSHGNAATSPRLADVIGFFKPEHVETVAKAVLSIHRDFGDRANRKHARLKFVLEERGVDWFRGEMEKRIGFKLEPARPFQFTHQGDMFGWHPQSDGNCFLGLYVETGRIQDGPGCQLKTALRKVAEQFGVEIRLTAFQNLILANIPPTQREPISKVLADHGIAVENQAGRVRRSSMACVALPTCGLALAESERVFPELLGKLDVVLRELGLGEEDFIVRMTGCPNGCARPYLAEIGFVGKSPNKYQIYLGGNASGTRLNRLYKDSVLFHSLTEELKPVLGRFVRERMAGERFGDWCARAIWSESANRGAAPAS
jgi:sulfite reductase (NADPH) hemoprotein beta-component